MKRYDIVIFEGDWMRKESPDGDYVRYEDAHAEIARLRKALRFSCESARNEMYDCGLNAANARIEKLELKVEAYKRYRIRNRKLETCRDALGEYLYDSSKRQQAQDAYIAAAQEE